MSEYQAPPIAPLEGRPGKVQAIAIMTLIDGILNILVGIGWGIGILGTVLATFGLGFIALLCCPVGIYAVVVGVLEILFAAKLLPDPPKVREFAKYVAIMQIVNIVSLNVLSPVTGILALVFANDPEVMAYFQSVPQQEYGPS